MAEITQYPFNGMLAPPGITWFHRGVGLALSAWLFPTSAEKWTYRKLIAQGSPVHKHANCAQWDWTVLPVLHPSASVLTWLVCNIEFSFKPVVTVDWFLRQLMSEIFGACSFYICLRVMLTSSSKLHPSVKWIQNDPPMPPQRSYNIVRKTDNQGESKYYKRDMNNIWEVK